MNGYGMRGECIAACKGGSKGGGFKGWGGHQRVGRGGSIEYKASNMRREDVSLPGAQHRGKQRLTGGAAPRYGLQGMGGRVSGSCPSKAPSN